MFTLTVTTIILLSIVACLALVAHWLTPLGSPPDCSDSPLNQLMKMETCRSKFERTPEGDWKRTRAVYSEKTGQYYRVTEVLK